MVGEVGVELGRTVPVRRVPVRRASGTARREPGEGGVAADVSRTGCAPSAPCGATLGRRLPLPVKPCFGWSVRPWGSVPAPDGRGGRWAGILMGLGALLIPGGNDTLLMVGLPMGAWQAALAYVLFVASVAALIARFGSMARSWS